MLKTLRIACVLALVITLGACSAGNIPQPAPAIPGLAQTLAAQTLTARNSGYVRIATPQPVSVANDQITFSQLPTATPGNSGSPEVQLTPAKLTQMARMRQEEGNGCTNQAEFVGDISVPDGTEMKSGQRFTKTWQFKNAGTCTWTKDFTLVFVWGELMGGPTSMPIGVEVAPEQMVNISISLVAPEEPNYYQGNWMFETPNGSRFGTGYQGRQFFWVSIEIPGGKNTARRILGGCSLSGG